MLFVSTHVCASAAKCMIIHFYAVFKIIHFKSQFLMLQTFSLPGPTVCVLSINPASVSRASIIFIISLVSNAYSRT